MFMTNTPAVPKVFFAMPGLKHACPNSAACWSPASPRMGIYRAEDGRVGSCQIHPKTEVPWAAPPKERSFCDKALRPIYKIN